MHAILLCYKWNDLRCISIVRFGRLLYLNVEMTSKIQDLDKFHMTLIQVYNLVQQSFSVKQNRSLPYVIT